MGRWSRPPKGGDSLVKILVLGTSDRGFKSHPPHQNPTRDKVLGSVVEYLQHHRNKDPCPTLVSIGPKLIGRTCSGLLADSS